MDTGQLVAGGAKGLAKVAELAREAGLPIYGVYLIKTTSDEGGVYWNLRLISPVRSRTVIEEIVRLRSAGSLPAMDFGVRIKGVPLDDPEARRVIAYAERAGELPVEIIDTPIDGLFVEYALVADLKRPEKAAA